MEISSGEGRKLYTAREINGQYLTLDQYRLLDIGFGNYSLFRDEKFVEIKPITLLTGKNNTGKTSIINAAKLLKENAEGTLPFWLSLLPDEYGHLFRSFENIRNSEGAEDPVSFYYKLKLPALGDNCVGSLSYDHYDKESDAQLNTFSLYTTLHEDPQQILSLVSGYYDRRDKLFDRASINFKLIKEIIEQRFLPVLLNEDHKYDHLLYKEEVWDYQYIENMPRFGFEPGNNYRTNNELPHLNQHVKSHEWLKYDKTKPLFPYYMVLMDEISNDNQKSAENRALLDEVKQLYAQKGIVFNIDNNRKFYEFFKEQEEDLFEYLYEECTIPLLAIDLSSRAEMNNRNPEKKGYYWFYDAVYSSIPRYKKVVDPAYLKLMSAYIDANVDGLTHLNLNPNSSILCEFIFQSIYDALESLSQKINLVSFFSSDLIEQSAGYLPRTIMGSTLTWLVKKGSEEMYDFIRQNLKFMNIADDFSIVARDGLYSVWLKKKDVKTNLADFGIGVTRLFFLIIALYGSAIIYIENPENDLDAEMQEKLTDLFISMKSGTQFIIETHSEAMIRRFQQHIEDGELETGELVMNIL